MNHDHPPMASDELGEEDFFEHDEVAALALELWRVRGCPEGSHEEDWLRAEEILRSGASAH